MNDDCLKLTIYCGERDRAGGMFLADALMEIFARHELQLGVVVRATSGFGLTHQLRSDRLLTLSEDLPLVCLAVDRRDRLQTALDDIETLSFEVSSRWSAHGCSPASSKPSSCPRTLTRPPRSPSTSASGESRVAPRLQAVVDLVHRHGVAGATVLLGIDGTAHGVRQHGRFFARNAAVPLMVICVGDGERIAAALPELGHMLARPLLTLERVRVCKRDGQRLAQPHQLPATDRWGQQLWQKLMVYASEQSRYDGKPLYV